MLTDPLKKEAGFVDLTHNQVTLIMARLHTLPTSILRLPKSDS
jgi:hypothetical protein